MSVDIITGDALSVLRTLRDGTFRCAVTSPPHYGLRSYLPDDHPAKALELGHEPTAEAFIAKLVEVFREVRRTLTKDGTLWLNFADSYAGSWGAEGRRETPAQPGWRNSVENQPKISRRQSSAPGGVKRKDLMLLPERLLIALQVDGWWVRDRIVWAKPNPMPASVRDRFCNAWEPVFLLSKSRRYWFDQEAAREPLESCDYDVKRMIESKERTGGKHRTLDDHRNAASATSNIGKRRSVGRADSRLMRNVWSIPVAGFKGAHFASFPPLLAERCVAIGSKPGDRVLDPFGGAGTVGLLAHRLKRDATLIELSPRYAEMARKRITDDAPLLELLAPVAIEPAPLLEAMQAAAE